MRLAHSDLAPSSEHAPSVIVLVLVVVCPKAVVLRVFNGYEGTKQATAQHLR